jgi:replicative DNA helicase
MAQPKRNGKPELPANVQAEEAVLGGLFIVPEMFADVMDILNQYDFHIVRNQWVFEAMLQCFLDGTPIDNVSVADQLNRQDRLYGSDSVGGDAYLTALANCAGPSYNLLDHARIVKDYSLRREKIEKANQTVALMYDETLPIESALGTVEKIWEDRRGTGKTTVVDAQTAAAQFKTRIESNMPAALDTGLPNEKLVFGGFPLEAQTLVTADSGVGKTAKTFQAAEYVVEQGGRVLFFSFEHSPGRLIARRAFASLGIPMVKWRNGTLTSGEKNLLANEIDNWEKAHRGFMIDNQGRTLSSMKRSVRQGRPDLIIIDDAMHVEEASKSSNDVKQLLETMAQLGRLSLLDSHPAAVVTIHHITADEAQKNMPGGSFKQKPPTGNVAPSLIGLAEAKNMRYIIDVWLALVPDFQAKPTDKRMKVIEWIMKDREGERYDNIELYFFKERQLFFDNTNPQGSRLVGQMPSVAPSNGLVMP